MGEDRRKRSAIEPPSALVLHDAPAPGPPRRPMPTSFGAVLVGVRALAGAAWLGAFALLWPELSAEAKLEGEIAHWVLWLILGFGGIGVLLLLLLGVLVWRGSNTARVLVLLGMTGSIVTAAIGYFSSGEEITVRTTLLTLAADILVLLALSSRDARTWARGHRERRAALRRGRREPTR